MERSPNQTIAHLFRPTPAGSVWFIVFFGLWLGFGPGVNGLDSEFDHGFDVLSYRFDLEVTDEDDVVYGETFLELVAKRTVEEVTLDLVGAGPPGSPSSDSSPRVALGMRVSAVAMAPSTPGASLDRRGLEEEFFTDLEFDHSSDSLSIRLPLPLEVGEERVLRVSYSGVPADGLIIGKNRFGERTFFSDNYPNRARHYLPTVDHPSDKALCGFSVTAPMRYQVIGCGLKVEETDLPEGQRRTVWQNQVPISTKVMTMGIARFAVESLGSMDGIPIETWVYPQDREKGFRDFAATPEILRFFHLNIGPYPYEKMVSVQSTTRYGGMENAGNVFYGEKVVSGRGDNEELIAHELAHQWFGDSVSERAWRHVWLSEGFATYGAALYLEQQHGSDRLEQVMTKARRTISRFAEAKPTESVLRDEEVDLSEILNPNVYQKGAFTLHMLRKQIGDETFRKVLKTYYARFRDRSAMTEDFQRTAEEVSGQELGWFFEQWLERAGHPLVRGSVELAGLGQPASVHLEQSSPSGRPYDLLLDLGLLDQDGELLELVTVRLTDPQQSFRVSAETHAVILDPAAWALIEGAGELLEPVGMVRSD